MQILAAVPIVNMYTLAVLAVAAIFLPMLRRKRKKYPPGPAGLPIIGNMFDMPSQFQWITFANWSKDYGKHPYRVLQTNLTHFMHRCRLSSGPCKNFWTIRRRAEFSSVCQ